MAGPLSLRLKQNLIPLRRLRAFAFAPLQAPLCACARASAQNKAAHRPLKGRICPLPIQPAQDRRTRGTRPGPLSAARFPAWHGSQVAVARDRSIIAAYMGQTAQSASGGRDSSLL